jgi:TRAP-type mannitol/chloroaromatic compound transport system permease large subunit
MFGTSGRPIRTIAVGFGIAMVIASTLVVPTIGTLSTWKIVLGVIGLAIVVRAGREGRG